MGRKGFKVVSINYEKSSIKNLLLWFFVVIVHTYYSK